MAVSKVSVLVPPQPTLGIGSKALLEVIGLFAAAVAGSLEHRRRQREAERRARRRAKDHGALLALARQYAASQPSFASDLQAAALRDSDPA